MKQILVIDREFGAGGSTIAEKIARRLGWRLLDHALTEEIARLASVPPEVCARGEERLDPWMHRLAKIIWRGSYQQNIPPPDLTSFDTDRLVALVQQVVGRAVETSPCIVVGRGSPYFLRHRTDTFCVFLYAPRELRFRRVLSRVKNEAEAVELVDRTDDERRKFVKYYFDSEWPDRHLFHAMLNTSIGDEATADAVLFLMNRADHAT
ncbi:MAG: cytidylate kinase-like family protein [Candidatus Omnitrophica bacterium]|nr:cytidylate kinase-like family protein [Candidatus Omnitrophota bacterium]